MIFVKNNDCIEIIFDSLKSLLIRFLLQYKISIQRLKVKKSATSKKNNIFKYLCLDRFLVPIGSWARSMMKDVENLNHITENC